MTFAVGNSGRPKGSVNKVSTKFADTMNKHGVDIAQEMLEAWNEARTDGNQELAFKILSEMAQYVYPKLKTTEHIKASALDDMTPQQKIDALKQAVALLEQKANNE